MTVEELKIVRDCIDEQVNEEVSSVIINRIITNIVDKMD